MQIIHLKRFQLLNSKWVKSQKIVKFPFTDFDPSNYLVSRTNNQNTTEQCSQANSQSKSHADDATISSRLRDDGTPQQRSHDVDTKTDEQVVNTSNHCNNSCDNSLQLHRSPAKTSNSTLNGDIVPDVVESQKSKHTQKLEEQKETGDVGTAGNDDVNVSFELEDYTDVRYDLKSMAVRLRR